MDIKTLKNLILEALTELGITAALEEIDVTPSLQSEHGDLSSNVALKLAGRKKMAPRLLAEKIRERLPLTGLSRIEVAGPGFLNFFLAADSFVPLLKKIIAEGDDYGRGEKKDRRIDIEFVSANPTGELHVGHARIAAVGDSLARLLAFAGYDVTREYYVNDGGNQVHNLALSLRARYHELAGDRDYPFPEDGYHGEDITRIAAELYAEHGRRYLSDTEADLSFIAQYGIEREMAGIKKDLDRFGVSFDVFTKETTIRENDGVMKVLKNKYAPYLYEKDGAMFLKTSAFGDDKDRVVIKSDGSFTYLAPDIAYHLDKLKRGYDELIDVFGADHHGYVTRLRGALMMQGHQAEVLDVVLVQIVRLLRGEEELVMSKRTGTGISLAELIDLVGVDAVRWFLIERAPSSHLDFDLDLALEQSAKNPVYYAQYAHARLAGVLALRGDLRPDPTKAPLAGDEERELLIALSEFPHLVESAARERSPRLLANYVQHLAALIHAFYHAGRIIDQEKIALSQARLALTKASLIVMKNALTLVGVSAPEHM